MLSRSVGIHCMQGASAVVAPATASPLTHFFSFPLGQVNKAEQDLAQEKCNLEKELAKYKVFRILFRFLLYHCLLYQFICTTRWVVGLHTKVWGPEKPGSWLRLHTLQSCSLSSFGASSVRTSGVPVSHQCPGPLTPERELRGLWEARG